MEMKVEKDVLTITIPISKAAVDAAQPSKGGKSRIVAGTGGFAMVQGTNLKLNLSLIAPLAQ